MQFRQTSGLVCLSWSRCRAKWFARHLAIRPLAGQTHPVSVALLVAAEQSAALIDPRAALAAHEQEVGAAVFRPLTRVHWRAEDRDHQLAGALVGIVGIAVAPDVGAGLGPHLDDVVAEHAAGEIYFVYRIRVTPSVAAEARSSPLPVVEGGVEIIL